MGRPKSDDARDTRREILRSALDLFSDLGFDGTSMRALAAAVGVRESALYHYFPSKEAVLVEVFADHMAERFTNVESELGALMNEPFARVLEVTTQKVLADMRSPQARKITRLMFTEGKRLGEEGATMQRLREQPVRFMSRMLQHFKDKGEVRQDLDPEVLRLHFAAPLMFVSNIFGNLRPLGISVERFIEQHVEFMLRAVTPPGAEKRRTKVAARAARTPRPRTPRREKR